MRRGRNRKGGDEEGGLSEKKERNPNWSKIEILSLIAAKRPKYIDEMTVEEPKELMCPKLGKWGQIVFVLNSTRGEEEVEMKGDACKYKWSTLLSDFKKI